MCIRIIYMYNLFHTFHTLCLGTNRFSFIFFHFIKMYVNVIIVFIKANSKTDGLRTLQKDFINFIRPFSGNKYTLLVDDNFHCFLFSFSCPVQYKHIACLDTTGIFNSHFPWIIGTFATVYFMIDIYLFIYLPLSYIKSPFTILES